LHTLQPVAKGKRVSTIGAIANTGLVTAFCFEGTLNAGVFVYFIIHFLIPKLKPGNVVVLDNASPHHHCFN
jgi:transposase